MRFSGTSSNRPTLPSSSVNLKRSTASSPETPAFIEEHIKYDLPDGPELNLTNQRVSIDNLRELCTWLPSQNPQIPIKIYLSGNMFGDDGTQLLATLLTEPCCVTVLDLSCCRLSATGIATLCSVLHENTTLHELNLDFNPFIGCGEAIASMLSVNKTLKSLGLRGTKDLKCVFGGKGPGRQLGEGGVRSIAQALEKNSSLETLDLNGNRCGDKGLRALAKMLKSNKTLTDLNLCGVGIKHGFRYLCKVLESNEVLRLLHLGNHSFRGKQIGALGRVLANNQTLRCLNLAGCWFYDEQGTCDSEQFYEGLKANTGLRSLTTAGGRPSATVNALATLLKNPKSHIEVIDMSRLNLMKKELSVLDDAMETNESLIKFSIGLGYGVTKDDLLAIKNATARNRERRPGLPNEAGLALYALLHEAFEKGKAPFIPQDMMAPELAKAFESMADVPAMLNTINAIAE